MNNILEEIENINPDNEFIKYIIERIRNNNYRGLHISQHNRYNLEYIEIVLKSIYDIVKEKHFKIPPGDYRKTEGEKLKPHYNEYKEIVDNIANTEIPERQSNGTYNSIKKNIFVDLNRMGFLNRFDKNGNLITKEKRSSVYQASITEYARQFINEENSLLKKYQLFTQAIEKLFSNRLTEIVETLYYSDYRNTTISIYEFMFILLDDNLEKNRKIDLLKSYRTIEKFKRKNFIELMKTYASPSNFKGDKTQKRDFHNWKNESQQIFTLLKTTIYFEGVENQYLKLNGSGTGIFSDALLKQQRSQSIKTEYFQKHKIGKMKNFDLHHIIAFRHAKNKEEFKLIEDYKNLIYLSRAKHKEITKNQDKNIILFADADKVEFKDFDNNSIIADNNNNKEVKYSKNKTDVMNRYNAQLLKSIFQYDKPEENKHVIS